MKILKDGVALAAIVLVTLALGATRHSLVAEFVWQSEMFTGKFTIPVSAEAVMMPIAPTLVAAIEKTPVPVTPGICTIPSPDGVTAMAIISGVGVFDAESSRVLTPLMIGAAVVLVLVQLNCGSTSIGLKATVEVKAITKLWLASGAIVAGVFGVPVRAFVSGSVG